MELDQFDFDLPKHLIAQRPPDRRSGGRLLHVDGERFVDRAVVDFPDLLNSPDLLVFNDTRVIPARCIGRKIPGGGRFEVFLERIVAPQVALVQIGTSKVVRIGQEFTIGEERGVVEDRDGDFFRVRFAGGDVSGLFERYGRIPLPPYIDRPDENSDRERYQTVFARQPGAVAAPTAGLHFDQDLLDAIDRRGVARTALTLHVGAGTFQPVRAARIEDHRMHAERYRIDTSLISAIDETRRRGGRVVAVGTTVVRALESAVDDAGVLHSGERETRIFIYPGYRFRIVDAMLTNFHLPKSTLLMMIGAFAGRERILDAYRHAVDREYRFFSYGDAMFVERAG